MRARFSSGVLAAATLVVATVLGLFGSIAEAGPALQTAANFTVTCANTATPIAGTGDGGGYNSVYCQNMSTTSVYLGGSTVTTSAAPCISTNTSNCPRADFPWDVSRSAAPSCIVASGTVDIKCIAGK